MTMPPTKADTDFFSRSCQQPVHTFRKIHAYGDWYENRMGYYALLDGLHKYILGWLDINQIEIIAVSGNYWLDQRELSSDGAKLLVIFLDMLMMEG